MATKKTTPKKTSKKTTVIHTTSDFTVCSDALESLLNGFGNGDTTQVQEAILLLNNTFNGHINKKPADVSPNVAKLSEKAYSLINQFHASVKTVKFGFDPATVNMHSTNLPDASRKLNYVLQSTHDAAQILFGLVERQEKILQDGDLAVAKLAEAARGNPAVAVYVAEHKRRMNQMQEVLSEVVTSQEFQDLCGQALKKVIKLVEEMEKNLATLLDCFGVEVPSAAETLESSPDTTKINQDDANNLLKELGLG